MKKFLVAVALAIVLMFSAPVLADADVTEIEPGVIMVHTTIYKGDFLKFYSATTNKSIRHYHILLHTPGGDAYTTVAIMNRMQDMQRSGITFTTEVHGLAMSAGTYIFMLGDKRIVHESSSLMFHSMIAQMSEYQRTALMENKPQEYNMYHRMDEYIKSVLGKITGWTKVVLDYWMDGGKAQYMSARTAYNTGFATHFVGGDI